jgi:hypothetical protein
MTTRQILSSVTRLAAAAVVVGTAASCGSEMLRTGRAPVFLIVDAVTASAGGGATFTSSLLSDVATDTGSVFNDLGRAAIRAELKDQGLFDGGTPAISPIQAVTITRYRVNFRRADGRNTPGVDVPFGFDGAMNITIDPGGTGDVTFDLVRHANKLEPPLRSLRGLGGQLVIATVADITFFGRDQNGNEVTASALLDVTFGDFPDDE